MLRRYGICFALTAITASCAAHDDATPAKANAHTTPPVAEDFRSAARCSDCLVHTPARLHLPETGIEAYSAKVLTGVPSVVTLLADRTVTTEAELLRAEAEAYRARYGKLTKDLHAVVTGAANDASMSIAIWTAVPMEHPRKEDLLADPELAAKHVASVSDALRVATSPVVAALRAKGAIVTESGLESPLVRAEIRAGDVVEISQHPNVARVGIDQRVRPQSPAWFQTVRANAAAALSTGNVTVCNQGASQPSDYTNLVVTRPGDVATPAGSTAVHELATMAFIRNNGPSGLTMTTASHDVVANWGGYVATTAAPNVLKWCWNQGATANNYSYSGVTTPGGPDIGDYQFDWFTKLYPYTLTVASSGDSNATGNDTVGNRGYNYLVVGGSDDKATASLADDTIWSTGTGYGSSWRNPTSTHNDRELPNLVAPAANLDLNISGVYGTFGGTSASAPIVTGAVALVAARDPSTFTSWPEMTRAVLIASSVHIVDGTQVVNLPAGDLKQGGGLLNAYYATQLATPSHFTAPGAAAVSMGRYRKTINFTSDFNASAMSNDVYNLKADVTGRMRVVITFDATAGGTCDANGLSCSTDILDGDMDLVIGNSDGSTVACISSTFDSSWEMCDIPVTAGQTFTARLHKYTTNAPTTYFGIAWMNYTHASD